MTSTALTVTAKGTSTGPVTLDIDITSSGFTFPGGPVEGLFTVNNLVGGGTGPFVLTASSPLGRRLPACMASRLLTNISTKSVQTIGASTPSDSSATRGAAAE